MYIQQAMGGGDCGCGCKGMGSSATALCSQSGMGHDGLDGIQDVLFGSTTSKVFFGVAVAILAWKGLGLGREKYRERRHKKSVGKMLAAARAWKARR